MPAAAPSAPEPTEYELLVMRAIARAVEHVKAQGKGAKARSTARLDEVADHLGPEYSPADRDQAENIRPASVRKAVTFLERDRLVWRSTARNQMVSFKLTPAGKRVVEAAEAAGTAPELPEHPEHRAWRQARDEAAAELVRLRAGVRAACDRVLEAAAGDDPDALEHPDAGDPRTIGGLVEDAVDVLAAALRDTAAPEPPDPR